MSGETWPPRESATTWEEDVDELPSCADDFAELLVEAGDADRLFVDELDDDAEDLEDVDLSESDSDSDSEFSASDSETELPSDPDSESDFEESESESESEDSDSDELLEELLAGDADLEASLSISSGIINAPRDGALLDCFFTGEIDRLLIPGLLRTDLTFLFTGSKAIFSSESESSEGSSEDDPFSLWLLSSLSEESELVD